MSGEIEILNQLSGQVAVQVARNGLERYVRHHEYYHPDLKELPEPLRKSGASFVTLTNQGSLRGCIGHTQANNPLAEDIARNAAAASRDFRFPPVQAEELADIRLEVTVLTPFQQIIFDDYEDLLNKLRPSTDGVMLTKGHRRALLLPQVWHRLPDKALFLEAIANKAGIPDQDLQASPPTIVVHIFQAQHFAEPGYQEPGN